MRVLYIDDIPTPYRLGIHRKLASIYNENYRVLFCAESEPGRSWELNCSGLDYKVLNGWKFRPSKQVNPFSYKLNFGVISALRLFQPDVVILSGYVHPTMWLAAFWCRRNGVSYGIVSESNRNTASDNLIKLWVKDKLMGAVIRGAKFGLPVSRAAGEHLRELAGNKELAIFQFPNTPDVTAIEAVIDASARMIQDRTDLRALGVPPDGEVILFVGRLIEAKRPLDLLAAYQQFPKELRENVHLVFIGDGQLRSQISVRKRAGDSVFCLGWISDVEQLIRIMASADLFVLPSSHEPWGAVVNEAMACGLPVVASDQVGAAQDMISNGENGFIFGCGKVEMLSELIKDYLQLKNRDEFSIAARRTATEFGETYAVRNFRAALNYAL